MMWQVQEAKQRFSALVRQALGEGPQVVTRHGEEVVVVVAAREFRELAAAGGDLKEFLSSGPDIELDIVRDRTPAREVAL